MFGGLVYFCLADVEVNGHSILPDVKSQGAAPECVPFAFCNAKEMNDKVEKIMLGESPGDETLDPFDLTNMYNERFPELPHGFPYGVHKLLYVGILLREFGCRTINGGERSKISDFFTISIGNPEMTWQMIADGRAVVTAFTSSDKAFSKLKFGEVYDPSSAWNRQKVIAHAVLLIGGIHFGEHSIDIFLNTHGKEFCALRNSAGEIMIGGIGMVLSQKFCSPVVICRSWETVLKGRLEGSWMVDVDETDQMFCTNGKGGLNDLSGVVAVGPTKAADCARHDNTVFQRARSSEGGQDRANTDAADAT